MKLNEELQTKRDREARIGAYQSNIRRDREYAGMTALLDDCLELLERMRPDLSVNASEDRLVESLGLLCGYGALMHSAARLWGRRNGTGAFVVGPTEAERANLAARIREVLTTPPEFRAER